MQEELPLIRIPLLSAIQWFRTRFNDCFDKAEWAKTRCSDEIPDSASFVEKLVYDRAIEIVSGDSLARSLRC